MNHAFTSPSLSAVEGLNRACCCRTLNEDRLREQLEIGPNLAGLAHGIALTRPHLFSSTVVFVSPTMAATIAATVAAIERVIALPQYQAAALARAPAIARRAFGPAGAFMGYDFHLGPQGPRLIEFDGVQTDLKFDVRAYAYGGKVQLLAARMYTGQTTNFRTPGGGFALVVIVP